MLLTDAVETCAKFCRGFANKEHPEVSFQTSEVLSEAQASIVELLMASFVYFLAPYGNEVIIGVFITVFETTDYHKL